MRKGEILERIGFILKEQVAIFREVQSLKLRYNSLRLLYQPRINELQEEANKLAKEFKELYGQSQEAYSSGDGETAKVLSIQGKAAQNRCESLNAEVNNMRSELDSILKKRRGCYSKLENFRDELDGLRKKLGDTRKSRVVGFGKSEIVSNTEVERILDRIPQTVFKHINSVGYVDRREINKLGEVVLGSYGMEADSRKHAIRIYEHNPLISENLERTVFHEAGHAVCRFCMSKELLLEWVKLCKVSKAYISGYAQRNFQEDFCECFSYFYHNPEKLQRVDERKYNFIKQLLDRLEKK